jgi:hypothetical protein
VKQGLIPESSPEYGTKKKKGKKTTYLNELQFRKRYADE